MSPARMSASAFFSSASFGAVDPCQQLGDGDVELGGDLPVEIDLRKERYQFRGFVYKNSAFPRA